jgi:hypothetical protein
MDDESGAPEAPASGSLVGRVNLDAGSESSTAPVEEPRWPAATKWLALALLIVAMVGALVLILQNALQVH